ncbi:pentapeptide repeat-containing protein, partial [Paraburkholderia sediminicola]|uniref:pentapeptide repeat-containing protein n=1 Tax=Paraburkholderia sediminicola TaxID=458836 RepID=UPI0038BAD153
MKTQASLLNSTVDRAATTSPNLSELTLHVRENQSPLEYAATRLTRLITPPQRVWESTRASAPPDDGATQEARPINERSLREYVRAALGIEHDAERVDNAVGKYLDELSKNTSVSPYTRSWRAQPPTESSFRLLLVLFMAYQVPGTVAYCTHDRKAFTEWLNAYLDSAEQIREDWIPAAYFDSVSVSQKREKYGDMYGDVQVIVGWQSTSGVEVPRMQRLNFRCAKLQGADLHSLDLQDADLEKADLHDTNLDCANLNRAKLNHAEMRGASLRHATLQNATLRGAKMQNATVSDADLKNVDLHGANLHRINLARTTLQNANLQGTNLFGASLHWADLQDANLEDADLQQAVLLFTALQNAKLQKANLQRSFLQNTDLQGANLEDAELQYTDLGRADLRGATLRLTPEMATELVFDNTKERLKGTKLILAKGADVKDPLEQLWQFTVGRMIAKAKHWADIRYANFDHRNYKGNGNVLTTIAGLDESCRELKRIMMNAVVAGLELQRGINPEAMAGLNPSLGDVLFGHPGYMAGYDGFVDWLCAGLLGDGSQLMDASLCDTALEALGDYA